MPSKPPALPSIPPPDKIFNNGIAIVNQAAKDTGKAVDKGIEHTKNEAQRTIDHAMKIASDVLSESEALNKDVMKRIQEVSDALRLGKISSKEAERLLHETKQEIQAVTQRTMENIQQVNKILEEAGKIKIDEAITASAAKIVSNALDKLSPEEISGLASSLAKNIDVNHVLETKILGNLRIVDFAMEGFIERLDPTGMERCVRQDLVNSFRKRPPAGEVDVKLRVTQTAVACIGKQAAGKHRSTALQKVATPDESKPPVSAESEQIAAENAKQVEIQFEKLNSISKDLAAADSIAKKAQTDLKQLTAPGAQ